MSRTGWPAGSTRLPRPRAVPLYRATLEFDRHRLAEINAEITGQAYEPGDPAWDFSKALYAAAACDPDVLRAYTSVAALTATPADVLAEPGMLDKVITGSARRRRGTPPQARPAPNSSPPSSP